MLQQQKLASTKKITWLYSIKYKMYVKDCFSRKVTINYIWILQAKNSIYETIYHPNDILFYVKINTRKDLKSFNRETYIRSFLLKDISSFLKVILKIAKIFLHNWQIREIVFREPRKLCVKIRKRKLKIGKNWYIRTGLISTG